MKRAFTMDGIESFCQDQLAKTADRRSSSSHLFDQLASAVLLENAALLRSLAEHRPDQWQWTPADLDRLLLQRLPLGAPLIQGWGWVDWSFETRMNVYATAKFWIERLSMEEDLATHLLVLGKPAQCGAWQ